MNTEKIPFYDASKESASAFAGRVCRESWENSPFVRVNADSEHFRSKRRWTYENLPLALYPEKIRSIIETEGGSYFHSNGYSETCGPDGIGTAVEFANATDIFDTMAGNLVAMSADDVAAGGDIPLVYMNVIDYQRLETEKEQAAYAKLFEGLARVAKEQDIVILTGESAGLRHTVASSNPNATFPFNWSGGMNGVSHKELEIRKDVRAGDLIVALKQPGFASNGISKVREALARKYGPNWFQDAPRQEIVEAMAAPIIYARALSKINGWYDNGERETIMRSVDHLSGGSFVSKYLEATLAPLGLSARFDTLYEVPEITRKAVEWLLLPFDSDETAAIYGKKNRDGVIMSPEEMFTTWCCGQRMLITVRTKEDAENVMETMGAFGIEAQIAGRVVETARWETPNIRIRTQDADGKTRIVKLSR